MVRDWTGNGRHGGRSAVGGLDHLLRFVTLSMPQRGSRQSLSTKAATAMKMQKVEESWWLLLLVSGGGANPGAEMN